MRHPWATLALALAAVALLAGCTPPGPGPAATPSATPSETSAPASPSPSPSSTETDPLALVDELVLRPTLIELRAAGAIVLEVDFTSDPGDAVAVFTELFGTPPVSEPYAGTNHAPPGVLHRWDAFVLVERQYSEEYRARHGTFGLQVYFDGPEAGGIAMLTQSGARVGDGWAEASAVAVASPWECGVTSAEVATYSWPDRDDRTVIVQMHTEDDARVTWLGAPIDEQVCM